MRPPGSCRVNAAMQQAGARTPLQAPGFAENPPRRHVSGRARMDARGGPDPNEFALGWEGERLHLPAAGDVKVRILELPDPCAWLLAMQGGQGSDARPSEGRYPLPPCPV